MPAQKKQSSGILAYRHSHGVLEVFLVHPGGPFWAKKDLGAWSIPKGEFNEDEDALEAAMREFDEETGIMVNWDKKAFTPLGSARQKSGKTVFAWAQEADFDTTSIKSNTFPLEWPPRSGKTIQVPEVDKGEWFGIKEAKEKINPGQVVLIAALEKTLRI